MDCKNCSASYLKKMEQKSPVTFRACSGVKCRVEWMLYKFMCGLCDLQCDLL